MWKIVERSTKSQLYIYIYNNNGEKKEQRKVIGWASR